MIKHCDTCYLCDKTKQICLLNGISVNLNEDYCSKHSEEIIPCEICGIPLVMPAVFEKDPCGNWHIYCQKCNKMLGTCRFCPNNMKCEFETNPDPMPKVVVKTVKQGNMVMQTQIRNEERVKKFCHSCSCWIGEDVNACGKEFGIGCNKKPSIFS